jgi:molybdenum cofactor cytidylyltransferase
LTDPLRLPYLPTLPMRFEGTVTIDAPREAVWGFLTDPESVASCAPGVETVEVLVPNKLFRATASVGFGSVRARFVTDVEWLDLDPPSRARMKAHGNAPGSAVDATSEMELRDAEDGTTELEWSADVSVVGTIASLAARLMGGVTQKLTAAFFEKVKTRVEGAAPKSYRFGPVPLAEAEGKLLGHNVTGADGTLALRKGRPLSVADVALLGSLGRTSVYVAEPGSGDVGEDEAARRVAQSSLGAGLKLVGPSSGRANLVATTLGVLRVDAGRLARVNEIEGFAVATLTGDRPVRDGQVVATVKVLPFALPEEAVRQGEAEAGEGGPLLSVTPLVERAVVLLLCGSPSSRERVARDFEPPLRARMGTLGSSIRSLEFVPLEDEKGETALAEALRRQVAAGAEILLLAGETAIVDRHDIAPRAIERAGGDVVAFGAPVDPGQLLLLAYFGTVPLVAAPGCARSAKENVLDLVLPRLLAGDRLGRSDLVGLGHGGLLEDVPERGLPRGKIGPVS